MSQIRIAYMFVLLGLSQAADLGHGRQTDKIVKADMNDVHFLLWTRNNAEDDGYYELLINDVDTLALSPFDVSLPTYVVVHGWNNDGRSGWPIEAKTELLNNDDCNVISIDWGKIAKNINYFGVVANLKNVSQHAANFLDFMHNDAGLDLTSLHLTGHSLGSHLSGNIGSLVVNGPIGRITGLDPAGPEFYSATLEERLDQSDASFVDVIHTNAGPLLDFCVGLNEQIGHVDYYPNGGDHQPGCTIGGDWTELLTAGCSHSRSHNYWVESINGEKPFLARPCPDWDTFQSGGCPDCGQGCLEMGLHASTELRGIYFLETRAYKPYAKG